MTFRPLTIAHVVSTFDPHYGGMGAVAYDEARLLASRGHRVTVFTMRYPGDPEAESKDGFVIKRLRPVLRSGDGGLVFFGDSFKGFDAIHLHAPWYGSMLTFSLAAFWSQVPLFVTYHMTGTPKGFIKRIVALILDFLESRVVFWLARKIFVVSHPYFAKHHALTKADKTIELPNGVDTKLFHPPASVGMSNEKKELLFVGNLLPVKRLDILLRALAAGDRDWTLTVVGQGYSEQEYRSLAEKLGVSARTRFVGSIARRDLPQFYHAADCVVVPSENESFSLVALEALASGIPVVVSDVPGAGERVADGAIAFTAGSVEDLVRAIREALAKDKIAGSLPSTFLQKYSLEAHVTLLEKMYQESMYVF